MFKQFSLVWVEFCLQTVKYQKCSILNTSVHRSFLLPRRLGLKIHRMYVCSGVRPLPNEYPVYDTKQYDWVVPEMLDFWGMQSTPSLPSLPGQLWPGVVAPDRVLSRGQIELSGVLMQNWIVWNCIGFNIETALTLNWIVGNRTGFTLKLHWGKTELFEMELFD